MVEDDFDSAEALEGILQHAGYGVRLAFTAIEARAVALDYLPSIALIDIGLPVVSGYEVAATLRDQVERCRLIAMTGYVGSEMIERSLSAGFEAHLTKPLELPRLFELLARRDPAPRPARHD